MKVAATITVVLVLVLLYLSPWLNEEQTKKILINNIDVAGGIDNSYEINKVPFGYTIKVYVSSCPICPGFSEEVYFVSALRTLHRVD